MYCSARVSVLNIVLKFSLKYVNVSETETNNRTQTMYRFLFTHLNVGVEEESDGSVLLCPFLRLRA